MKWNRRGFFGIMAGGAVAAPTAVKHLGQVIRQTETASAPVNSLGKYIHSSVFIKDDEEGTEDSLKYLRTRLLELYKDANSNSDIKYHDSNRIAIKTEEIDKLKSVSFPNKIRMLQDYRLNVQRKNNMEYINNEIQSIKEHIFKKFGLKM